MTHSLSNMGPRDASASKKSKTCIHTQKLQGSWLTKWIVENIVKCVVPKEKGKDLT